ncbi:hypothetical protein [Terricaulis silvestris]|uniref:Uncharacterized protein n=1 Tax=Terricaulis silvestris TaxID=2686094 RepID=A0A6I6MJQ0_9CAUL|nr:hypothetical protein [Terricaulis silvestris]QGZ93286.1 hypothetical protein DSM104635_00095 [Terricaulis silvestris]
MSDPNVERDLIALGVPRHVASYVAEQRPLRIPLLSSVGVLVVMIGGFAVGTILWAVLEALLELNARAAAETSGALLYHHNFGIGLLIALFAWIGASGVIIGVIPMLSRRLAAGEFYETIVGSANAPDQRSERSARWGIRRMMEELRDEHDPARYVSRATFAWMKPAAIVAASALALAAIVTFRELNTYTLYFADHYEERHTFLPSPTIRSWSDATRVEVGCNHVSRESDDPVYEVHFRDGGSTRIDSAFPVSNTWVDQVEIIDATLVSIGARFEPWSWLDRDAYHPRCLMANAVWLGDEQYARFRRLIRAPDSPRDLVHD